MEIKVWICSLVLAVSGLTVSSQTCPSDHFSAIFVGTIETIVDDLAIDVPDPELHFFRNLEMKTLCIFSKMRFIFSTILLALTFLCQHQLTNMNYFMRMQL